MHYIPCLVELPVGVDCDPYDKFNKFMDSYSFKILSIETKVNLNDKDNPIKQRYDEIVLRFGSDYDLKLAS